MNRKNLTAAVLAGLAGAVGIAGTASAGGAGPGVQLPSDLMHINPDGVGEVLIYPYYSTNAGNSTLISVVNSTSKPKAVKVRFKEGENSREVLDFNLYLSEYDVWTAALADSADFTGGAVVGIPHMFTADNSCTVPYLYESASTAPGLQAFLDFDYTGDNEDGGSEDMARAAEGHLEMIEMGTMKEGRPASWHDNFKTFQGFFPECDLDDIVDIENGDCYNEPTTLGDYAFGTAVTHILNSEGEAVPRDCQYLVDHWSVISSVQGNWFEEIWEVFPPNTLPAINENATAVTDIMGTSGGLFGSAAVINVGEGTMYSYDAIAIGGYHTATEGDPIGQMHHYPGRSTPSLNSGSVEDSILFSGGDLFFGNYSRSIDALSSLFMHDAVMNEYVIDANINGASEWVMSFPTKNFYVDDALKQKAGTKQVYSNDPDAPACYFDSDDVTTGGFPAGDDVCVDTDGDGLHSDEVPNRIQGKWSVFSTFASAGTVGPYVYWSAGPVCSGLASSGNLFPNPDPVDCNVLVSNVNVFFGTAPFSSSFDGEACENVKLEVWDRNESPKSSKFVDIPPIVSPPPPDVPNVHEAQLPAVLRSERGEVG